MAKGVGLTWLAWSSTQDRGRHFHDLKCLLTLILLCAHRTGGWGERGGWGTDRRCPTVLCLMYNIAFADCMELLLRGRGERQA